MRPLYTLCPEERVEGFLFLLESAVHKGGELYSLSRAQEVFGLDLGSRPNESRRVG